jgi:hypothetical protein
MQADDKEVQDVNWASGINIAFQSISALTSPEFIAVAAESQPAAPAQPPRKRLKLGSLDGVAISAADTKNHWDEFKEEYPEYAKAVLSADSDEWITLILDLFTALIATLFIRIYSCRFPVTSLSLTTYLQ